MSSEQESFDEGPSSKKLRTEDAVVPNSPVKITDIEIKCLERVFKYLNVVDLFNVAEANTYLRKAAQQVYKGKQIRKVEMHRNEGTPLLLKDEELHVNGLKTQFRFLRYFGHLITSLNIEYVHIPANFRDYMDQYIIENCADTLVELSLGGTDEYIFEDLKKPFPNVENFSVYAWQMPSLDGKWFPKLHNLELDCDGLDESESEKIETFIKSCPNLKCLRLRTFLNEGICQSVSELPVLETFGIGLDGDYYKYFDFESVNIHLKNVKKFIILGEPFKFDCNPYNLLTFEDSLEEVEFAHAEIEFYSEDTLEFFARNKNIKRLTLLGTYSKPPMNDDELAELKESLPSLTEVNINGQTVPVDEIRDFQLNLAPGGSNKN